MTHTCLVGSVVNLAALAPVQRKRNSTGTLLGGMLIKVDTVEAPAGSMSDAKREPAVRMAKVLALQAAIASGTYHVSAAAVAGKIVDALLR